MMNQQRARLTRININNPAEAQHAQYLTRLLGRRRVLGDPRFGHVLFL